MNTSKWKQGTTRYILKNGVPVKVTKRKNPDVGEKQFYADEVGDHFYLSSTEAKKLHGRRVTKSKYKQTEKNFERVNIHH
jgi:hypothetical protein